MENTELENLNIKLAELKENKNKTMDQKREMDDLRFRINWLTPNPYSNKDGVPTPATPYIAATNYEPQKSPYNSKPSITDSNLLQTQNPETKFDINSNKYKLLNDNAQNNAFILATQKVTGKGGKRTKKRKTKKSKKVLTKRRKTSRRK